MRADRDMFIRCGGEMQSTFEHRAIIIGAGAKAAMLTNQSWETS